ncbi:MAG: biotin synthase BioB [Deltaproteobacteria bacterium]|nr:MAG: biotin synthase BioB [Deltaproteobacteria bacterium]
MAGTIRHDWTREEIAALWERPLPDLILLAQQAHRAHFPADEVQLSTLLSIKTGLCPEDCAYCPQSAHHNTELEPERVLDVETVVARAREAKAAGATRYCMGAAWRRPSDRQLEKVIDLVQGVRALGMETCVTLGMLTASQAQRLAEAGLDYYNHNIDTSPEYYGEIITTRSFDDRLETLGHVREAGLKTCCGGIVGMGEDRADRVAMVHTLATLPEHPQSVPINLLVRVPGTPLQDAEPLDPFELVRTIAVTRITMPASAVRLSAGREEMDDATQALCLLAGANSFFSGPRLLTTPNPQADRDRALLDRLGMRPVAGEAADVDAAPAGAAEPSPCAGRASADAATASR